MKKRLTYLILQVLGHMPLWMLHSLGNMLGLLLFCLPTKIRYYVGRNLQLCLPAQSSWQRRWLILRNLCEACKGVLEAPLFWVRSQEKLLSMVQNQAEVLPLQQALAEQTGAIVLGLHQGAYYLNRPLLAKFTPNGTYIYKPQKGVLGEFMAKHRDDFGGEMVEADPIGIRHLYRRLKQGGLAGVTCDHTAADPGYIRVPLFGIDVPAMGLPAKLAQKSGAPVFMMVMERLSWARGFRFHLWRTSPELANPNAEIAVRAMCAEIEAAARRWPTQFEWHYRRFRHSKLAGEPIYRQRKSLSR